MSEKSHEPESAGRDDVLSRTVGRREFLKIAGIAGATVGVGAGLGGLVAACGGGTTTTTVAPASVTTTTAAPASTTTSAAVEASTTTVVSGPAVGREIRLGFVAPLTGPLAAMGVSDKYSIDRAKAAFGDGVLCGDGQKHPIAITVADCQSDSNRAAQVAGDLINNTKVDIIMAASSGTVVPPVADQAEANGVPCITNDCPWANYVFTRGGNPKTAWKWTYNVFWGTEDVIANYFDIWGQVPTNKKVGALFSNDALGNAYFPAFKAAMAPAGWSPDLAGQYQPETDDYSSVISQFKKAGDEVLVGVFSPGDFTNLWKQCLQQGWNPKVVTASVALSFPEAVTAVGPTATNLCASISWLPTMPFTSALLNGETCQTFADKFTAATSKQWNQSLLHFQLFEWAWDVLKRTVNVDDKNAILEAVRGTKMDTIYGPIDFTAPIGAAKPGTGRVTENCYKSPLVGGQWRKGTGKWPFEPTIVSNVSAPMVPVMDKVQPIVYTA